MNLKDYLHLYLGCEVVFDNKKWQLRRVGIKYCQLNKGIYENADVHHHQVKPILRPLSDMTGEERSTAKNIDFDFDTYPKSARLTVYLLSKHFDLFGLIDAGLAVNKQLIKFNCK